uniref:C-type lectin domain-containing protein n=1 Tax=Acrobeloides nanus TaxID=290746 RepID=A0A914C2U5_9BILA
MISWGSVNGKVQYNLPWDSGAHPYVKYPPVVWFQDIWRQDRTPYLLEEAQLIKRLNGCPLGYHSSVNNWTCYNTYDTPLSFSDAQTACKNSYSNVVTINNAFENTDIRGYASKFTNCDKFYIGLSNLIEIGKMA